MRYNPPVLDRGDGSMGGLWGPSRMHRVVCTRSTRTRTRVESVGVRHLLTLTEPWRWTAPYSQLYHGVACLLPLWLPIPCRPTA